MLTPTLPPAGLVGTFRRAARRLLRTARVPDGPSRRVAMLLVFASWSLGIEQPFYYDAPGEHCVRRDHLTAEQRSLAMSKVHRRDTSAEIRLRKELWKAGVRGWRCDLPSLPGRPDVAFTRWRVAVFVDGLLWHGHPKRYPANLNEAWRDKVAANIARDHRVNSALDGLGWVVIRIWDEEIHQQPAESVARVVAALDNARGRMEAHDGAT